MLEIKHLRTIKAISELGSITQAANQLATTQSALSHQLKELERKLAANLVQRNNRELTLTRQGLSIKTLADELLPKLDAVVATITDKPQLQSLSLGFACHACFQWLMPICNSLQQHFPKLQLDYRDDIFDTNTDVDILITDEPNKHNKTVNISLGHFEQVVIISEQNPLTQKTQLTPQDFQRQTLLTYPVATHRLDIFNQFLTPAGVIPNKVRQVSNSHTIIQMVHSNLGIAVLPNWLVNAYQYQSGIKSLSLNTKIEKQLFIQLKPEVASLTSTQHLVLESQAKFATLMQPFSV